MKKILLFLFIFIPFIVRAENCTIVSGNGTTIGDEISCGTEHFYVIENNDDNVTMMSKYNLYVGYIFEKMVLDMNETYIKYNDCRDANCYSYNSRTFFYNGEEVTNNEWETKIKEQANVTELDHISIGAEYSYNRKALFTEIDSEPYYEENKIFLNRTYKLYPYTTITRETNGYALQNVLARGVAGNKGNADYPLYATLPLFVAVSSDERDTTQKYDNFETGYLNFEFNDESYIKYYLDEYKTNLSNMGYNALEVDLINIKEINNLVKSISNSDLPLASWYNESLNSEKIDNDSYSGEYKLGDLKEYLSDKYKWLWSTSYWTKTFVGNSLPSAGSMQVYFVASSGEICYSMSNCSGIPRAGIRPIVTLPKSSINIPAGEPETGNATVVDNIYNIASETDGKGSIEVVKTAHSGDKISFRVAPQPNYKISSLTIFDKAGNSITFSEDQIINNNDGTISINSFTMPSDDVKIIAKFESIIAGAIEEVLINPKTGVFSPIFIFVGTLLASGIVYVILLRKKLVDIQM